MNEVSTALPTAVLAEELAHADDWRVRRRAALRLGRGGDRSAFAALAAALGDRDPDVRHAVILALGRLGDGRAVELLCRPVVLEDASPEIRWAAVSALGQLGDLGIANELAEVLDDPEWVVRNQALLVLAELIRRMPETIDGEQIRVLIRLLAIQDPELRGVVVEALARRSTRGLDEMVQAMRLRSRAVRAGVAEALGLSRDPRAVAPLMDAASDPVAVVRREAVRGLGRLGDPRAVEVLVTALGDADSATAAAAVVAVQAIGEAAVSALCSALEHNLSKMHRRSVILALGGIRDPRSVIPLLNNLSSTYYVVRQAAITALSAFGQQVVDELVPMVEVSSVPLEPLVLELAQQTNKRLRLRAIRALGELKNAAAVLPLRELMREADRQVVATTQEALSKIGLAAWARYGAVIALGNLGARRAVPALVSALADHSEQVRAEAARALAKLGADSAVPDLVAALDRDQDHAVRREACAALRAISGGGLGVTAAFRRALCDPSWEVRAEAARALGRIDDEASVVALLELLDDGSYTVRTAAVHALANLGALALPCLVQEISRAQGPRLDATLETLLEIVGDRCRAEVESLRGMDPAARRAALDAMPGLVGAGGRPCG